MDNLSIIIRCKNEERWIGHTIQSCLDYIDSPEIIIIDNNSTDESLQIVRSFAHDPLLPINKKYTEIKIKKIENYSPGKSINLGINEATKDNVLIISSHCILTSFNLKFIEESLKQYCCIFGKQTPIYRGKRITKRYIWSNFSDKRTVNMYSKDEERYFMHNALSCFKRKTLIDNPFDENLQGKEDRYWAIKMIDSGKEILYDPILSCNHHYTNNGNTWKGIG